RGRLDILGQRLALEEATVTIQGSFLPVVRIRATTQTDEYAINVTVAGPVTNPEITFSSDPDLPQEEVLARLIFGRGLDTLSPFQAARLALAVRTLAGQGGEGIVGSIRQGAGLADLDVTVDEAGNAAVTAGAYLGENLYTDVTVGAGGETELNLNLDLSQSFTLKGSVTNEGDTAFGVYFERDY
ncbi:MAG: translocation/assembly module TamB domain-containing protein, partial [Roseovarius confluentis]